MEGEEKSQIDVESVPLDAGNVARAVSPSAETASGVTCTSSPAPVTSPQSPVIHPKQTENDSKSECDTPESNDEIDKCLKTSEDGALASGREDISVMDSVQDKCQEPLAEGSSESCDNPKTDSEADLAVQNNDLSKNEATSSKTCQDSHQKSSEKTISAQLTETSSNETSKTESEGNVPILGTQISGHSVLLDSNKSSEISSSDEKLQENYIATSPQEKEVKQQESLNEAVESEKENHVNTADVSTVQSEKPNTSSVDDTSNASSEAVTPMAHANLNQLDVEEAMDTTPVCEDRDPFYSKGEEKDDTVPMEVDSEPKPVPAAAEPQAPLVDDSSVSETTSKSDNAVMEVDSSPTTCEGIVSNDLAKNSANEITENIEGNSNDKHTHSEKDTASPDSDQTIIGSKMPEDMCIVPDTTSKGGSKNDKTSQNTKETSSEEVSSSSAGSQEISKSDKAAMKDSTQSASSSTTEQASNEQGDAPSSENDETVANKTVEVNKPRVGIHLVSTSSLVSRQDTTATSEPVDSDDLSESNSNDATLQADDSPDANCAECGKMAKCKYKINKGIGHVYICEDDCYTKFRKANDSSRQKTVKPRNVDHAYEHTCGQCSEIVDMKLEKSLTWETMDFCNEECLEKCQRTHGSNCANCKAYVKAVSLGKYCVRFGYDMKQFCSAPCLEDFKKGLKVCSYCQRDISRGEGFLAPVGDKSTFKDFCAQECMEKYEQMSNNAVPPEVTHECAVCNEVKSVKVEVLWEENLHKLCSDPCFAAFKFVKNIVADKCDMCKKYYDRDRQKHFSVFYDEAPHSFCCKTCMNVYILAKRKIVPCSWCKVKKYNFDMIKKVSGGQNVVMMCSLNCLEQFQASPSAAASTSKPSTRKIAVKKALASTTTSADKEKSTAKTRTIPVISSVTSLAPSAGQLPPASVDLPAAPAQVTSGISKTTSTETVKTVYKQQFILRPPPHPEMSNCAIQVKPVTASKSVSCQPEVCEAATQTDDAAHQPVLIPIPVPIYIPMPMHMYTIPYPVPVPIALPIPVPFFIPTTKNSAKGILQEIKRIQENIPSDPYEAELLMMAEMVAGEKKGENTESDSEDGGNDAGNATDPDFSPEHQDAIGDDMLQMALMGTDFDEPPADFDSTVTPTSVSQSGRSRAAETKDESDGEDIEGDRSSLANSGKKAVKRSSSRSSSVSSKRMRTSSASDHPSAQPGQEFKAFLKEESVEKPDANMCLKFSLGVNAWKNWVIQKNVELEKSPSNKIKPFKTELLHLSSDELNYTLCLFVCEAQDRNGRQFTPDTLYYLCLGIQRYLMENGREANIFCDPYYEKFTDCLDDAVKRFSPLESSSERLVTRIQEEYLWESKQLGTYSPFVLLNTLMYFNTKHFNLTTVEEHMQLSFSHIMKHWKRNATSPSTKTLGVRGNNVLLRFYPPQSALAANSKKKKVYEQQENESNPSRCPVKLYEFYLSKCPESVKTRNDVFYLLPERSCVPDSPVWYSTMSLDHDHLQKMLHRIKVVREIVEL